MYVLAFLFLFNYFFFFRLVCLVFVSILCPHLGCNGPQKSQFVLYLGFESWIVRSAKTKRVGAEGTLLSIYSVEHTQRKKMKTTFKMSNVYVIILQYRYSVCNSINAI